MNIEIRIQNRAVEVYLLDNDSVVDSVVIETEHRLSEDLLPTIDRLIVENKLSIKEMETMTLRSDMGENFTTQRIASAVVNTFNWSKTLQ